LIDSEIHSKEKQNPENINWKSGKFESFSSQRKIFAKEIRSPLAKTPKV